jgi:hypothetical protein
MRRATSEGATSDAVVGTAAHSDAIAVDADQIVARLSWTPRQRLKYLVDMLDFEERARAARRVP